MRVGGVFANDRAGLEADEGRLAQVVEDLEHQFRELCGDLLPFTFASKLCIDLGKQLDAESTSAMEFTSGAYPVASG